MNFSYTSNPGYLDLVLDMYTSVRWVYSEEIWQNYTFPEDFYSDFRKYYKFPLEESYPILYIAIFFTIVRYIFELGLCKVIVNFYLLYLYDERWKLNLLFKNFSR